MNKNWLKIKMGRARGGGGKHVKGGRERKRGREKE